MFHFRSLFFFYFWIEGRGQFVRICGKHEITPFFSLYDIFPYCYKFTQIGCYFCALNVKFGTNNMENDFQTTNNGVVRFSNYQQRCSTGSRHDVVQVKPISIYQLFTSFAVNKEQPNKFL